MATRVPLEARLVGKRAHAGPTLVRLLARVLSHVVQEASLAAEYTRADSALEPLLVVDHVLDEVDVAFQTARAGLALKRLLASVLAQMSLHARFVRERARAQQTPDRVFVDVYVLQQLAEAGECFRARVALELFLLACVGCASRFLVGTHMQHQARLPRKGAAALFALVRPPTRGVPTHVHHQMFLVYALVRA